MFTFKAIAHNKPHRAGFLLTISNSKKCHRSAKFLMAFDVKKKPSKPKQSTNDFAQNVSIFWFWCFTFECRRRGICLSAIWMHSHNGKQIVNKLRAQCYWPLQLITNIYRFAIQTSFWHCTFINLLNKQKCNCFITFSRVVQCHVLLWPLSRFVDKPDQFEWSHVAFEIVEKYTTDFCDLYCTWLILGRSAVAIGWLIFVEWGIHLLLIVNKFYYLSLQGSIVKLHNLIANILRT